MFYTEKNIPLTNIVLLFNEAFQGHRVIATMQVANIRKGRGDEDKKRYAPTWDSFNTERAEDTKCRNLTEATQNSTLQ